MLDKEFIYLYKALKRLEHFDIFFSFRSSLRAKFIKFCISSKSKYQFDKKKYNKAHQVDKYNNFLNDSLKINTNASGLILHAEKKIKDRKK